jgi:hypothetical protein
MGRRASAGYDKFKCNRKGAKEDAKKTGNEDFLHFFASSRLHFLAYPGDA